MELTTFAELGLSSKVLSSITDAGYTIPTPIQAQAIPVAMTGRDVLGIAQTGTGKTAAFTLPMISRLESGRARARMPRSLILAPTRELAAQVAQAFEKYGVNHKLAVALLIGGVSMDDQVAKLDRGVDVLIATPGRLLDHFGRGRIMLMGVEILVIDEADRMLDMGFIPDIEKICKLLPPRRQTLFFSATMPPEITRLVDQFLKDPTRIEVAKPATAAQTITQRFQFCPNGEDWAKRDALRTLIRAQENLKNAIIFCNRKRDVAILLKSLVKHGFNAGALHGDMDQMSRTATLDKFRAGEITILAASDVAARGLDIPEVSHVFNFDVPWQGDDYVHRIGRTGRAGREGMSATLVTLDDIKALKEIEKITGEPAVWLGEAPSAEDLAEGATRKRRRGAPAAKAGRGDDRRGSSRNGSGDRERSAPRSGRPPRAERPPLRDAESGVLAATGGDPGASEAPRQAQLAVADAPDGNDARERSRRRRRGERPARPAHEAARESARDSAAPVAGLGEQPSTLDVAPPQREAAGRDGQAQRGDEPRRDSQNRDNQRSQHRGDGRRPPRDDRRPSRDRAPRNGAPREGVPPERQPRDQQAREPSRDQPSGERRPRGDQPPRQTDERDDRRSERRPRRDDSGPRVGFEDNIPAFLRRPARPQG